MNKPFKKLTMALGTVLLLAACGTGTTSTPPETVTVTFFKDTIGTIYQEVDVVKGAKVTKPTDPTRTGYTFDDWYTTTALTTTFDFNTTINADTDVFAKFTKDYVPDTTVWHLIGDFKNTSYPAPWDLTNGDNMSLVKAQDSNLFSFTIEIGYNAAFKVKELGNGWDPDYKVYGYDDIVAADKTTLGNTVVKGDFNNIVVKNAGNYKFEFESDLEEIRFTRLGDATGAGVTPNPDPNAIIDISIVGSFTGWGATENSDIMLDFNDTDNYYSGLVVELPKDGQFKLRENEDWAVSYGWDAIDLTESQIPANAFSQGLENDGITTNQNIVVEIGGLYSVWFQNIDNEPTLRFFAVEFYIAGEINSVLTNPPSNWSNQIKLTQDSSNPLVFTATGLVLAKDDVFKVKLGYSWNLSFGYPELATNAAFVEANGNIKVDTAGTYTLTLTLTKLASGISVSGAIVLA